MDLFHSLGGMLEAEVTSADIPGILDAVSNAGICLFSVTQKDELTIGVIFSREDHKKIRALCQKRGDSLRLTHRKGLFWRGKILLGRPVLLFGIGLLLCLILWVPSRVFFVEVEGNDTLSARQILEAAEKCGIGFGASRREVRSERIKNALLQEMPGLQWAGVNTYGCVAVISVRERSVQKTAQLPEGMGSIVALRDGIITDCTATKGTLLCQPGQAVEKGQVLISGYTDCGLTIQVTRAEGEVYAKTYRDLTVVMPSERDVQVETGEVRRAWSLILGKKRINLWKDSGISDTTCGRIYEEYYVTLPGGFALPVALAVEEYPVYNVVDGEAGEQAARDRLEAFAVDYLCTQMVAGKIDSRTVTFTRTEGCFRLTGKYICTEMIGKVQWEQIGE